MASDLPAARGLSGSFVAILGSQARGAAVPYDKLQRDFLATEASVGASLFVDTADFPSFSNRSQYALVLDRTFASEASVKAYCASQRFPFGCSYHTL